MSISYLYCNAYFRAIEKDSINPINVKGTAATNTSDKANVGVFVSTPLSFVGLCVLKFRRWKGFHPCVICPTTAISMPDVCKARAQRAVATTTMMVEKVTR
jgi:hypothetical protein